LFKTCLGITVPPILLERADEVIERRAGGLVISKPSQ
jgi:hypothetical protein